MDGSRGLKRRRATVGKDWRQSLAAALWSGLILLAALLFSQKMAGALLAPVSPATACLVATLAFAPSLLAWSLWAPIGVVRSCSAVRWRAATITLLAPLGIGIALLPASFGFAHWYLAALLAVSCVGVILLSNSDLFAVKSGRKSVIDAGQSGRMAYVAAATKLPLVVAVSSRESRVGETQHERLLALDGLLHPPYFWQQLTRTSSPQDGDVLQGSVTVRFEPGQRQANVHIPFVPPFSTVPTIECSALDGCDVRLKVGTLQTFGIRIEAKRAGDCELAESAEIGFSATVPASQANAA